MLDENFCIDFTQEKTVLRVFPRAPVLSSRQAQWNSIYVEHHCWDFHEMPEHYHAQHTVVLLHAKESIELERMVDGCYHQERIVNNDTWVLPANVQHGSWSDAAAEFTLLVLDPLLVAQSAYEFVAPDRIELMPTLPKSDPFLYQLGLALKAELETDGGGCHFYIDSAATMLCAHLFRHYSTQKHLLPQKTKGLSKYRLQQALDYINAHYIEEISLNAIAQEVGISQYYLVRLFKQSLGVTPYQYLISRRIQTAKQFLKSPGLTVEQVGYRLGFASHTQFTKFFRKYTGLTPRGYRQRL